MLNFRIDIVTLSGVLKVMDMLHKFYLIENRKGMTWPLPDWCRTDLLWALGGCDCAGSQLSQF